ncbi:unnamed protein product [Brassica rapa subsp. narinosa]|uniref:(rape) hypothetical protein n=1 Tax=Brassica napus TaxID=3708 RepID=A0A816X616_BRANA|nr:unnamed protein product [Brassica napus]
MQAKRMEDKTGPTVAEEAHTVGRFRFVSNPDVLERVYTLQTEIMHIKEKLVDDDQQPKSSEST